jgi:HK97 family phage major capsid protein
MNDLAGIMREVRAASENITTAENHTNKSLAELRTKYGGLESTVNDVLRKLQRPGSEVGGDTDERKHAVQYCMTKHALTVPKNDGHAALYVPSSSEVEDATLATKAIRSLFRHGNIERLDNLERKSLTSFAFGSNQFVLPPQMSDRVLSCLVDPSDISGLMGQETTSGGSLKFLIDSARMGAGWGCDASCFANQAAPDLSDMLGELEVKCEPIRYVACAGNDLLQDASFDVESWLIRKVSTAFRFVINAAIIIGDGVGKPLGILNPAGGIPVCETGAATPVGQFSWQDVFQLKYDVPVQWHQGGSYFMNQRTLALLFTTSTAEGRPLFGQLPSGLPGLQFAGSPIVIVSQMPDVAPGSAPIAFGNWKEAYCVVTRSATTMRPDPYSAGGFCTLFRFEARVGGAPTCPNAARLLRIK